MHLRTKRQQKRKQKLSKDDILIGELKGAHGVKGLVRIAVYAEDISLFDFVADYRIKLKNKHKNNIWLAHVEGITDKDAADALKGSKLYISRDQMPEPEADEVYLFDLIGMECVDEEGNIIGKVIKVDNFGAGDLLDIAPPSGPSFYLSYDEKTVLEIGDKITILWPDVV